MLADIVRTGLSSWWAPLLAVLAGVVSFASPCVFPLVPGYISFVTGGDAGEERHPVVPIGLFILGFSAVFTSTGAFSSVLAPLLRSSIGLRVSGAIILAFGLLMLLYALRLGRPSWFAERRPLLSKVKPGRATAFPLGMAFAAGWTPCIGPVYGGILVIAANGGTLRGVFLLALYSLGLGIPFLLIGLGVRRLVTGLDFLKRHYGTIAGVSGVVMTIIGVLLVSGLWLRFLGPVLTRLSEIPPLL